MKIICVFLICTFIFCSCASNKDYWLHKRRADDCCFHIDREDSKFEKTEQWAGVVMMIGGFLSFFTGFLGKASGMDNNLGNNLAGSGLLSAFSGILISWDGIGAFQEMRKCEVNEKCDRSRRWWEK